MAPLLPQHFEVGRFDSGPVPAGSWRALGAESLNASASQKVAYEAALQVEPPARGGGQHAPSQTHARTHARRDATRAIATRHRN
jgi:hypothetical protein